MQIEQAHLNKGVRAIGLDNVLHWVRSAQAANPDTPLVSVGSGNGALESLVQAICVDPEPLSYASDGLGQPYCAPRYAHLAELIAAEPELVGASILLLNWCQPNKSTYDHEAIELLKPKAVLSLYEVFYGSGGAAGGEAFHDWRKSGAYHLVQEAHLEDAELDIRIGWWQRDGQAPVDLPDRYPALIHLQEPCSLQ